MDNKVLLTDLAEGLARRKSISKKDAENFIRVVFDTIQGQLLAGESVKVKGLGTFIQINFFKYWVMGILWWYGD